MVNCYEIKELIMDYLEMPELDINDLGDEESIFGDGLGLDSIDAVELGIRIKKKYKLTYPKNMKDIQKIFKNPKTIVDFINNGIIQENQN